MDENRSTVAKMTRAQIKYQFNKKIDEYYEKKQKEKKGESEKSHNSHTMNATEGKKREELELGKVTRNSEEIVRISSSSNDEEQEWDNANLKIFNRKRKETVKKIFNDDESSGSDVRILGEEELVGEMNLKEFNRIRRRRRRRRETIDVRILGEEDVGEVNMKEFNRMRRRSRKVTVYKGRNGDGETGSSVNILQEWDKGEEVTANKMNIRGSKTIVKGKNDCDDNDGGSGRDVFVTEEDAAPNMRCNYEEDDGKMSLSKRHYIKEKEYNEDVGILGKSMEDNEKQDSMGGNVNSESSSRKKKAHGNLRDDEVVSKLSCQRPLLHSTPKSRKQGPGLGISRKCHFHVSYSESFDFSGEDSDSSDQVPKKKNEGSRIYKLSKRRGNALREVDYMNILLGSMLKDDEQAKENLFSFGDNGPTHTLPLKFRCDNEDPVPTKKEDWQKEIDNLFAEMEMCLISPDSNITESSTDGTYHVTAIAKSQAELCLLGEHQLMLEEPIGIVCKCCQIVHMEMKDICPALKKKTPRRQDWVDHSRYDCFGIHEIHFGESTSGNYYTSINAEGSVLDLIPDDIRM